MVSKKITSLQHPLVKHWVELRNQKSYRQETQRLLIVGKKMVEELIPDVLITLEDSEEISCKEKIIVTEPILKKITGLETPDGFAAEIAMPKKETHWKDKKRILILDQVRDPGNLGTLLRAALALGWEGVITTPGTVDLFNDKALRAGKGAQFHLPLGELSQEKILDLNLQLYIADLEGTSLEKGHFSRSLALILSNEAHGARNWPNAEKITIPMRSSIESLNVATSGAILLYEMRAT